MSDNKLTVIKLGGRGAKGDTPAEPTSFAAFDLSAVINGLDETQVSALLSSAVSKAVLAGVGAEWRESGMTVYEKDEPQTVSVKSALAFVNEALAPKAAAASAKQRADAAEAKAADAFAKADAMQSLIAAMMGGDEAEIKAARKVCKGLGITF